MGMLENLNTSGGTTAPNVPARPIRLTEARLAGIGDPKPEVMKLAQACEYLDQFAGSKGFKFGEAEVRNFTAACNALVPPLEAALRKFVGGYLDKLPLDGVVSGCNSLIFGLTLDEANPLRVTLLTNARNALQQPALSNAVALATGEIDTERRASVDWKNLHRDARQIFGNLKECQEEIRKLGRGNARPAEEAKVAFQKLHGLADELEKLMDQLIDLIPPKNGRNLIKQKTNNFSLLRVDISLVRSTNFVTCDGNFDSLLSKMERFFTMGSLSPPSAPRGPSGPRSFRVGFEG